MHYQGEIHPYVVYHQAKTIPQLECISLSRFPFLSLPIRCFQAFLDHDEPLLMKGMPSQVILSPNTH